MNGEGGERADGSATPPPVVRPAVDADSGAIARIRVASWRATYAGSIPATVLDRMDVGRTGAWIAGRLAQPEGRATLVIEAGGADGRSVRGYALMAPCRDDDAAGLGEVEAIYLDPDERGTGLGRPLLEAAVEGLRAEGFEVAVLWVLTANIGARRFYERAGFRPDGATRAIDFDGTRVDEIRYRRATSAWARTITGDAQSGR
jgi:L-amino acid N-acyltransferase YncA